MILRATCLAFTLLLYSTAAVKDKKLYDALGVAEDADERQIKKSYRKAALCGPILRRFSSSDALP